MRRWTLGIGCIAFLALGGAARAVVLPLGEPVPLWELPGLDKPFHALVRSPGRRGTVIVFWSNRCPACRGFEGQLIELAKEFQPRGLAFIAINSTDWLTQPEESFERMRRRSKSTGYPFPYVLDVHQGVARAYGVTRTPTVFIVDAERRLRYRGPIDERPKLTADLGPLHAALGEVARGKPLEQSLPCDGSPITFNPELRPPPSPAPLRPGRTIPLVALMGVDGALLTLRPPFSARLTVIVFTSQSSPVARDYEDGLIQLAARYGPRGVYMLLINPSDPAQAPDDGFAAMKARAERKRYPFPYLWDESQIVARAFGVAVTPHVFVVDRQGRVCYEGAIDDNPDAEKATAFYLPAALDALLDDRAPDPAGTKAFGAEIKWKPGSAP